MRGGRGGVGGGRGAIASNVEACSIVEEVIVKEIVLVCIRVFDSDW